ncbi:hypothetical protein [Lysobacter sp. D1-1-M9]
MGRKAWVTRSTKKTFHSLDRLGATRITLGKTMLFASQCVVLIHYELDQR